MGAATPIFGQTTAYGGSPNTGVGVLAPGIAPVKNAQGYVIGAGLPSPTSSGQQANTAAAPAPNTNSGVYTGGSGTAASTTGTGSGNVADIAAYTDNLNALNQLLAGTDVTQRNQQGAIDTGFNNANAQLDGNHQNTLNQYGTQKTNTTQDYQKALDQINSNARNGYQSLQMLLGGTGSAGNVLAPFAVSSQANQQRNGSSDAFAKNLQGIDQGVQAANQNYTNQKKSLEGQHSTQLQALLDSINQQKEQYLQQIGSTQNQLNIARGGNYQTPTAQNNAISALIAQEQNAPNQFAQPTFSVSDYVAPQLDLSQYQAQAARIANGGSAAPTDTTDPTAALTALMKQTNNNQYTY